MKTTARRSAKTSSSNYLFPLQVFPSPFFPHTDIPSLHILECDDEEGYYKSRIGEMLHTSYKVVQKLGKGVFSSVVKAVDIRTKDEVAIKIIRKGDIYQRSGQNEASVLQMLNEDDPMQKKHCIALYETFMHRKHLCFV